MLIVATRKFYLFDHVADNELMKSCNFLSFNIYILVLISIFSCDTLFVHFKNSYDNEIYTYLYVLY